MHTYTLTFEDDARDAAQTIHFEAIDCAAALTMAQRARRGRIATLAQDGKPLCRLERRPVGASDVWVIGPAGPAAHERSAMKWGPRPAGGLARPDRASAQPSANQPARSASPTA